MRKAILASMLLTLTLMAFGQHRAPEPGSGKPATKSKAKAKPKPKPSALDKPWDSPCGVHYEGGLLEIAKDTEVEWRLVAHSDEAEWYWNTQKTVCNRQTSILEAWIKHVVKSPKDEIAFSTAKYQLDCSSSRTRMIYLAAYNSKGRSIMSGKLEREWRETLPDSMMESAVNAICHKS